MADRARAKDADTRELIKIGRSSADCIEALLRTTLRQVEIGRRMTTHRDANGLVNSLLDSFVVSGYVPEADREHLRTRLESFVVTVIDRTAFRTSRAVETHLPGAFALGVLPHLSKKGSE